MAKLKFCPANKESDYPYDFTFMLMTGPPLEPLGYWGRQLDDLSESLNLTHCRDNPVGHCFSSPKGVPITMILVPTSGKELTTKGGGVRSEECRSRFGSGHQFCHRRDLC